MRKKGVELLAKTNSGKKPISQEEYVTNKVLSVFGTCLMGVLILMILQRLLDYGSTWRTGMMLQKALLVVSAAGVLWGLYLLARERAGKRSRVNRVLCGRNVLIVSVLAVLILTAIGYLGVAPIKALYVVLPVLAVYYLIYHSYAPEFFLISIDCGLAAGLIWLVRRALVSSNFGMLAYVGVGAAVVLAVAQIVWTLSLRKKQGKFAFAGRKIDLRLSRNAYTMLMVTPAVMAALVVAALLLPAGGLFYLAAAAVYLFITAVYYTVKLM